MSGLGNICLASDEEIPAHGSPPMYYQQYAGPWNSRMPNRMYRNVDQYQPLNYGEDPPLNNREAQESEQYYWPSIRDGRREEDAVYDPEMFDRPSRNLENRGTARQMQRVGGSYMSSMPIPSLIPPETDFNFTSIRQKAYGAPMSQMRTRTKPSRGQTSIIPKRNDMPRMAMPSLTEFVTSSILSIPKNGTATNEEEEEDKALPVINETPFDTKIYPHPSSYYSQQENRPLNVGEMRDAMALPKEILDRKKAQLMALQNLSKLKAMLHMANEEKRTKQHQREEARRQFLSCVSEQLQLMSSAKAAQLASSQAYRSLKEKEHDLSKANKGIHTLKEREDQLYEDLTQAEASLADADFNFIPQIKSTEDLKSFASYLNFGV